MTFKLRSLVCFAFQDNLAILVYNKDNTHAVCFVYKGLTPFLRSLNLTEKDLDQHESPLIALQPSMHLKSTPVTAFRYTDIRAAGYMTYREQI